MSDISRIPNTIQFLFSERHNNQSGVLSSVCMIICAVFCSIALLISLENFLTCNFVSIIWVVSWLTHSLLGHKGIFSCYPYYPRPGLVN